MTQDIEPFDYQRTNNMDEHKQIVNKVNEIVEVINDANLDDIPQLQSDVSTLKSDVANLESDVTQNTSDISRIDVDVGTLKSDVAGIKSNVGQNTTDIAGLDGDVDSLTTKVTNIESDITGLKAKDSEMANDIETAENAITTLNGKVIKRVSATVPSEGKLRTTITLEDNSTFATDDTILGLIATGGVQIISSTTARAFKLRFTLTDGSTWDTNDFVIPEGGGTDVTVTSVSIVAGTTTNTFKISIGLSDASTIDSNDYAFPTVPVASTSTAGIVKVGSGLTIDGNGVLSATPTGVPIATTGTAGIVKIGANINVTADGTISVTFPDAPDLSPYLTKAEASTTYITQTVANSTYATKANLSELTGQMMNTPANVIGMSSTSTSGLMSNSDKSKLDGIANGANNYVLPIGGTTIGGVKNGGNVKIETDGTMNISNGSDSWEQVTLDTIGTVKTGDRIKLSLVPLKINNLPSSWDVIPSSLSLAKDTDTFQEVSSVEFEIIGTSGQSVKPISQVLTSSRAIGIIMCSIASSFINNKRSWGQITYMAFNGAGCEYRSTEYGDDFIVSAYIKRA